MGTAQMQKHQAQHRRNRLMTNRRLIPKLLHLPEPSTSMRTRLRFVVPDEALTVRLDQSTLPKTARRESVGHRAPKSHAARSIWGLACRKTASISSSLPIRK